jgi:hypothetical protein
METIRMRIPNYTQYTYTLPATAVFLSPQDRRALKAMVKAELEARRIV